MDHIAPEEKEMRFGKQDIYFGKFYKAATYTNKKLLKDVFLIFFYKSRVLLIESWPDTVEEYCFDVLDWSRKRYRDSFNAEERKILIDPVESFEGDVSLLNKLIIKLFDNINLPTTFFNALRDLKNIRNRVCHDQLDFTEESLFSNMEDLKHLFSKFLNELSDAWDYDLSPFVFKYCNEVDEIMAAPITGEGLSYFENMERFREDLMGKFMTHGRKELFMFYARLKVLNPFTWLKDEKFPELQVDKIFTPLYITEANFEVDLENLLVTRPCVDEDDGHLIVYAGELPSAIVLTGIAGCGKTSLCRYLLYDWRNRLDTVVDMRSIDIVILIESRNIHTSSLVTYLQQVLLKETCSHFEEHDVLPTLQKLNVVYIVDGVDEATETGRMLIEEVLSVLGNSRIILTTRPEFLSSISESIHNHHLSYIKLQVHGFADVGIAKFTSKIFHCLEADEQLRLQQEKECLTFLEKASVYLGGHLKIPLTVALLIILWRDENSSVTNITSVTKLYQEIFKMCSMKMLSRIRKSTLNACLDHEDFTENWLLELGQQAFEMLRKDEYVIEDHRRSYLASFCNKHNIDSIHALSSFLVCEVQEGLYGPKHSFTFIHKSQMEYLAGKYFAYILITNYKKYCENESNVSEKVKKFTYFAEQEQIERNKLMNVSNCDSESSGSEKVGKFVRFVDQEQVERNKMMNVYFFTVGHLCMHDQNTDYLLAMVVRNLMDLKGMSKFFSALSRLVQESERHPLVCKMVSEFITNQYFWEPKEELCDPSHPMLNLLKYTDFTPVVATIRIINSTRGILTKRDKKFVLRPYENLGNVLQCIKKKPKIDITLRADQHFYNWRDQETTDHLLELLYPSSSLTTLMGHLGVDGAKCIMSFESLKNLDIRISSLEAILALNQSVAALHNKANIKMNLRLDISKEVLPSTLPRFCSSLVFSISLFDITDDKVSWAADVLSQISKQYTRIELLSSNLSSSACKEFLCSLTKEVKVDETILMPFFCSFTMEEKIELQDCVDCNLELW